MKDVGGGVVISYGRFPGKIVRKGMAILQVYVCAFSFDKGFRRFGHPLPGVQREILSQMETSPVRAKVSYEKVTCPRLSKLLL